MNPPMKKQTPADLRRSLDDQMKILRVHCSSFDSGVEVIAKHIAVVLRVLFHDTGRSRSLLSQLGQRSGRFFDTSTPLDASNLLSECGLVGVRMGSGEIRYVPNIPSDAAKVRKTEFGAWWNDHVLRDEKRRVYCRRQLVLNVADTDGGAHVDPNIDEAFHDITRAAGMGWVGRVPGQMSAAVLGVELACMRQLAWEALATLEKRSAI